MFALVDYNNFYASCGWVFNLNLQNNPVPILGKNNGCVISMSDVAKKIGLLFRPPNFKWSSIEKKKYYGIIIQLSIV
jgi:DNA polymerase V